MSVSTTASVVSYSGNGVTTAFSFPYEYRAAADLKVVVVSSANVGTAKTLTTHYTVSGVSDSHGGYSSATVTMITAPASGETLIIYRQPSAVQETNLESEGNIPYAANNALDYLTYITQHLTNRALQMPVGTGPSFSPVLPDWPDDDGVTYTLGPNAARTALSWLTPLSSSSTASSAWLPVIQSSTVAAGMEDYLDAGAWTATGGSAANSLKARAGWDLQLQDFGTAIGDGSTDCTSAATAANTAGGRIGVPKGTSYYATDKTDPISDLNSAVWTGPGQIEINGYAMAPFRSIITGAVTAPSTNRYQFFHATFPKAYRASFMGVYTSTPTPSSGSYTNFRELSADIHIHDYTAGFNASTSGNSSGRSGAFKDTLLMYHGGQGDLVGRNFYGEIYSAKASASHWLANPALVVENGNLGISAAGGNGGYLNHSEYVFADNGYYCSVIDRVRNYDRDNNATTLGVVWIHDRPQSVGTYEADCVYSISGKWKRGLDTTPATFDANKAAITLKALDRTYLNSSSTIDSAGAYWYSDTLGSVYTHYNSGAGVVSFEVVGAGIRTSHATIGMGYSAGAGGTVTQLTDKSTSVTLNKVSGQITMNNATLNAGTEVGFTLTNSAIAATDVIIVNIATTATANSYQICVDAVASGSCHITLTNTSASNLGEALVLNFAVIKAAAA